MKKAFTLSLGFALAVFISFGAVVIPASTTAPSTLTTEPAMKASEVRIPVGNTGKFVTLQDLSTMKVADLEKLTGKKMGFLQRLEFKLSQKKLRKSINTDGTINNRKLASLAKKDIDGSTGFHLGGFALGFLLGLIGVLIAYLIHDDNHDNRVKWSWIGLGVLLVLILIAVL
jgi:hypothetical protein